MIIVVEGIDRVGKTTLCKKLSEKTGYPIFKNQPVFREREQSTEIELMNQLVSIAEYTAVDMILDRFHLSEFVYGYINRGYVNGSVMSIDERLSKLGAWLIVVSPTDVKRSSDEHGSSLMEHEKLMNTMFLASKMKKIKCDYFTLDKVVEMW